MTDGFLSLSSTEDELLADKDGAIKKALITQLQDQINRLKNPGKSDLSPEEFTQQDSLISALEESIKVIEMTWAKHHMADKQLH